MHYFSSNPFRCTILASSMLSKHQKLNDFRQGSREGEGPLTALSMEKEAGVWTASKRELGLLPGQPVPYPAAFCQVLEMSVRCSGSSDFLICLSKRLSMRTGSGESFQRYG
jgi:hypothetical protein